MLTDIKETRKRVKLFENKIIKVKKAMEFVRIYRTLDRDKRRELANGLLTTLTNCGLSPDSNLHNFNATIRCIEGACSDYKEVGNKNSVEITRSNDYTIFSFSYDEFTFIAKIRMGLNKNDECTVSLNKVPYPPNVSKILIMRMVSLVSEIESGNVVFYNVVTDEEYELNQEIISKFKTEYPND